MAYSQSEIDVFVSKLLSIQRRQDAATLSRDDRKELALSIGVSAEDWQAFESDFDGYLQRGHSFRQGGNDDDAIAEYTAAFIIDPYHEDLLMGLARSHARRFRHNGGAHDKEATEKYARRLLEIDPKNSRAVSIINELKSSNNHAWIIAISIAVGAGIGIVLGIAMRKVGIGVAVGAGLGLAVGVLINQLLAKKSNR